MERRIGEVARLVSRYPGTLRKYERDGVLPVARRDPVAGWRTYSPEDIAIIQAIIEAPPTDETRGSAHA